MTDPEETTGDRGRQNDFTMRGIEMTIGEGRLGDLEMILEVRRREILETNLEARLEAGAGEDLIGDLLSIIMTGQVGAEEGVAEIIIEIIEKINFQII